MISGQMDKHITRVATISAGVDKKAFVVLVRSEYVSNVLGRGH
jgi:hypothetical protein